MVFPLSVLNSARNQPVSIELKNGETYNGNLVNIDGYMNLNLKEVICTSRDGEKFWKMPNVYVRGLSIKYVRLRPDILNAVTDDGSAKPKQKKIRTRTLALRGAKKRKLVAPNTN